MDSAQLFSEKKTVIEYAMGNKCCVCDTGLEESNVARPREPDHIRQSSTKLMDTDGVVLTKRHPNVQLVGEELLVGDV